MTTIHIYKPEPDTQTTCPVSIREDLQGKKPDQYVRTVNIILQVGITRLSDVLLENFEPHIEDEDGRPRRASNLLYADQFGRAAPWNSRVTGKTGDNGTNTQNKPRDRLLLHSVISLSLIDM